MASYQTDDYWVVWQGDNCMNILTSEFENAVCVLLSVILTDGNVAQVPKKQIEQALPTLEEFLNNGFSVADVPENLRVAVDDIIPSLPIVLIPLFKEAVENFRGNSEDESAREKIKEVAHILKTKFNLSFQMKMGYCE